MSITTKKGDKGKTCLYGGKVVSKNHIRIEACGDLDEFCSFLGLAKSFVKGKKDKVIIESIQKDLFKIGTELVTEAKFINKLKKRLDTSCIKDIETMMVSMKKSLGTNMKCFCLPGANKVSASLDLARAVCRRLERRVLILKRKKAVKNNNILVYLNRLSDLLYLLARLKEA